jgi:SAM-dependent methyltransferase
MILYILVILLLLYIFVSNSKEGFENKYENKTFVDDHIYDNFYCKLYDDIWNMIPFYKAQIELMKPYFATTNNLLCFDSKTGHMPQLLSANMKVVGIDKSKHMIQLSKEKYPNIPFIQGDCDPSIFKSNLFTHIYCPLFSINTKDLELFFECVDKWLVPKGYLFIVTYDKLNVSKFVMDKSKVEYNIEISDKITEKLKFHNKKRTNIQYLQAIQSLDYYKLITKIEINNYSCYLNVYQKD